MKPIFYSLIFAVACSSERDKDKFTYTAFSQSVVHLSLKDELKDSLAISAIVQTNIPKGSSESNSITVKTAGDYYLNIETDRPAKGVLILGRDQYNLLLLPDDTTHVIIRVLNDGTELSFYGKAKAISEYYLEKSKSLGYSDIRYPLNAPLSSKTTYKSLKQTTDSLINLELTFLKKYASTFGLTEWFLNYEESEIVYMGAGYKTNMVPANAMMHYFKDSIPDDYFDFIDQIKINNPKAVLSSQYFSFLGVYFLRDLPDNEISQLSGFSRANKIMSHQLDQSEVQLSGEVKDLYNKSNFSEMIRYYDDSLAIDSLANAFQLSDYKELVRIAGIKSRNEMEALNLNKGDTIPDFVLTNSLDSLVSIRKFKNQVLYLNFWATWCGPCIRNIPELNTLISQYERNPDIRFLNICVDDEREKWLAGVSKHKLRGVNLFAQGSWNSKLRAYFNFTGIPHYVIIDKGNILSENATDKAPKVEKKINVILTKN